MWLPRINWTGNKKCFILTKFESKKTLCKTFFCWELMGLNVVQVIWAEKMLPKHSETVRAQPQDPPLWRTEKNVHIIKKHFSQSPIPPPQLSWMCFDLCILLQVITEDLNAKGEYYLLFWAILQEYFTSGITGPGIITLEIICFSHALI